MPNTRILRAAAALLAAGCGQPEPDVEIAARVGATTITLDQVDARVESTDPKTWQTLYEARQRALDFLVEEQLLEQEASRRGVDRDSLVLREVTAQLAAVTDSAVAAFYEQNQQRMGGQSLASMRIRIRQYLTSNEHRRAWDGYLSRLREETAVTLRLEPPRAVIEIAAGDRVRGPQDAPVVVVEYSDFECPYCVRAQDAVQQVLEQYGDRVRHVYRDFPLAMHANAHVAAQAGLCAGEQGRFWEYHDLLFANSRQLQLEALRSYADELGLEAAAFDECLTSGRYESAVDDDMASGKAHGVTGTPAFFINGRRLSGARPFVEFQQIIDDELSRPGKT
jgi:protein-disulfide isomerase